MIPIISICLTSFSKQVMEPKQKKYENTGEKIYFWLKSNKYTSCSLKNIIRHSTSINIQDTKTC